MFKYQLNFQADTGLWGKVAGEYHSFGAAQFVAEHVNTYAYVQTVLISRIWIPRRP